MRNIMLHYTSAKKEGFFCMKKFKVGTKMNAKLKYISNLCILHYLHHKTADFQSKLGVVGGGEVVSKLDYFLFLNISEGNLGTPVGTFAKFDTPKEFWVVQNSKAGKNCASEWQRSKLMCFFDIFDHSKGNFMCYLSPITEYSKLDFFLF